MLLVISVKQDGSWEQIYYGAFIPVKEQARFSARDNKRMIAVTRLKAMAQQATSHTGPIAATDSGEPVPVVK
jgi:hypothetical protein